MKIQRILNHNECEEEDRNQKIHLLHSIAQLQLNQRWLNATCNFWPGSGPFKCLNQPIRVEKTNSSPTLPSLLLPVTCVLTTTMLGISLDQSEPAKARSDSSNQQTSAEEGTNYWRIRVTNISQCKSNQLLLVIHLNLELTWQGLPILFKCQLPIWRWSSLHMAVWGVIWGSAKPRLKRICRQKIDVVEFLNWRRQDRSWTVQCRNWEKLLVTSLNM